MKQSEVWAIVLAASVCSGILLGAVLFTTANREQEGSRSEITETVGQEEIPENAIEIIDGSGDTNVETETVCTEQNTLETEDFSAYYGTYVPKPGRKLTVNLDRNGDGMSKPHLISPKAFLYIDTMKRSEDGTALLGYMDYFGICQWIEMENLEKISDRDYSIHIGDECVICENWSSVMLAHQPQESSGIYDISFHPGDTLRVLRMQNGYFETSTPDGLLGWVSGDYVTKFQIGIPYRMEDDARDEKNGLLFYREFPREADVVLEEADGSIGEGSVLWFDRFSGGWGHTELEDAEVWISMMNAVPVSEMESQNVVSYIEYEKKPAGRTDFYKDGRTVGDGEYILLEAQHRILNDQDLEGLTLKGLSYAKNELYAKYGRKFEHKELMEYMETKTWYVPQYEARTYDELIVKQMNEFERKNIAFLNTKENALGPYKYD